MLEDDGGAANGDDDGGDMMVSRHASNTGSPAPHLRGIDEPTDPDLLQATIRASAAKKEKSKKKQKKQVYSDDDEEAAAPARDDVDAPSTAVNPDEEWPEEPKKKGKKGKKGKKVVEEEEDEVDGDGDGDAAQPVELDLESKAPVRASLEDEWPEEDVKPKGKKGKGKVGVFLSR